MAAFPTSFRLFASTTPCSSRGGNLLAKYYPKPLPSRSPPSATPRLVFDARSAPPTTTPATPASKPLPLASNALSPAVLPLTPPKTPTTAAINTPATTTTTTTAITATVNASAPPNKDKPFTRAVFIPEVVPVGEREARGPEDNAFEILGVKVPEKPWKPGEEDCCMSGCVHCVYDLYSESLSTYSESLSRAHDALVAASTPRSDWPVAVDRWKAKGGDQGAKKVLEDMDPAMKAFLEMEGRLKQTSAAVEVEGAKGT